MIKIPRRLTKIYGKKFKTCKHYELFKIYPHFVAYRCIENGQIENFTKNDFYTKEDLKDEQTNQTDSL